VPTARGWIVGALGLVLVIAGLAFGAKPVEQLGFALMVLVALALAVVRLGRHDLQIKRTVSPVRTGAGQPVTVTVDIANQGRGAAPLLLLEDRLPRSLDGHARFAVNGVESKGERRTTYVIRARRRGSYQIGPLEMSFVDPFGLARISRTTAATTAFLVHPAVEHLAMPREFGRNQSHAVSAIRQPTGIRGDDFYALREYVPGDDLRKIHWPSTGKRDKFMIRQEEIPWQTRTSIVVDDRRSAHEGTGGFSSFERSIDAAASLADLYQRSGYSYRLVGTEGERLSSGRGSDHLMRALDLLTTWDTTTSSTNGDIDPLLMRLSELESGRSAEGTLILITAHLSTEVAAALVRARRRFRQLMVVCFPAHRFGVASTKSRWQGEGETMDAVALLMRSGIRTLVLGPEDSLMGAWASLAATHARGGDLWAPKPEPA
jgi:uncharacterized protein (DUF58 family)